jgi:hypothetical protein
MKKCYIITFELSNPGINQDKLVTQIKTADNWARICDNTYMITSNQTSEFIRNNLFNMIYEGDKIYVGLLSNTAAWYGLDNDVTNWIRNNQK